VRSEIVGWLQQLGQQELEAKPKEDGAAYLASLPGHRCVPCNLSHNRQPLQMLHLCECQPLAMAWLWKKSLSGAADQAVPCSCCMLDQ
jgi:hypothetical protein